MKNLVKIYCAIDGIDSELKVFWFKFYFKFFLFDNRKYHEKVKNQDNAGS